MNIQKKSTYSLLSKRSKKRRGDFPQQQELIQILLVAAGAFFLLVVVLLAWHLPRVGGGNDQPTWRQFLIQRRKKNKSGGGQHRLAVLLPFVGEGPGVVPPYLNLFCKGARSADDVADFFLIHNGVMTAAGSENLSFCHTNIIFVNLESTKGMAERLLRVLDQKEKDLWKLPRDRLVQILTAHLNVYPYTLVEYKPAYGHIFADLLEGYSHWAYSDFDILFGDLGRHIEENEWNDYDLVTYGFGDQQRLYVKGQFTMHKISRQTEALWNGCEYLAHMDKRFDKIMSKKSKFRLESAEGCYSSVLMQNNDISIKFAVKAWTDVSTTDTAYRHGVYLYQHPKHTHKHVLAKQLSDDEDSTRLISLAQDWFQKDAVYKKRNEPLQIPIGAMEPLEVPSQHHHHGDGDDESHCMYWVQPKYQKYLCLKQKVLDTETLFWVKGKLYKQAFRKAELPSNVDTGPFFHFQEWKRSYRANQLMGLDDPEATVSVLVPQGGVVLSHAAAVRQWKSPLPPSPLGRHLSEWKPGKDDGDSIAHLWPTQKTYCLSGEPDRNKLRVECSHLVSWSDVKLVFAAPLWNQVSATFDVTLVQTARIHSKGPLEHNAKNSVLQTIQENLKRWKSQPSVVLLYVSPQVVDPVVNARNMLSQSDLDLGMALVGIVSVSASEDDDTENGGDITVSEKALQNMAIDVVPTRWYLAGLNRGDVIVSPDTVQLARRKAAAYQMSPGNLFLIPQFAFTDSKNVEGEEGDDKKLWDLAALDERHNHRLQMVEDFDPCFDDEDGDEKVDKFMESAVGLWWEETAVVLGKEGSTSKQLAERLGDAEQKLLAQFLDNKGGTMTSTRPPLMLIDNLGDSRGRSEQQRYLHVLAREVEEFGGDKCLNMLQLVQAVLFGFHLNVLEGAFAASTPSSRDVAYSQQKDSSENNYLCHGCFQLASADELRRKILQQELSRPVVARALWEHPGQR